MSKKGTVQDFEDGLEEEATAQPEEGEKVLQVQEVIYHDGTHEDRPALVAYLWPTKITSTQKKDGTPVPIKTTADSIRIDPIVGSKKTITTKDQAVLDAWKSLDGMTQEDAVAEAKSQGWDKIALVIEGGMAHGARASTGEGASGSKKVKNLTSSQAVHNLAKALTEAGNPPTISIEFEEGKLSFKVPTSKKVKVETERMLLPDGRTCVFFSDNTHEFGLPAQ